jgi:hypothetical protein
VITGGKFANGAQTAAFGYLFNCGLHDCWNQAKPVPVSQEAMKYANADSEALAQADAVGPVNAARARALGIDASDFVKDSNIPGSHNGQADAVRHCTWSCSMAQELGTDQAKLVGDIHELKGNSAYGGGRPQPLSEFIMDSWNNQIGRDIAPSSQSCSSSCVDALNSGKLFKLNGKPF